MTLPFPGCGCRQLQRPPAGSGTPPTSNESQHRRPRSARRRLQRDNGRNRGRGPLHRRLLLLEEDRWLMQRKRTGSARRGKPNPQPWAGRLARDRSAKRRAAGPPAGPAGCAARFHGIRTSRMPFCRSDKYCHNGGIAFHHHGVSLPRVREGDHGLSAGPLKRGL
jgi:hypothetical protein